MDITVIDCDWGGAILSDIEALLNGRRLPFHRKVFREPPEGNIVVGTTFSIRTTTR